MDLIYTNKNKEDVGVLHDYEFDLAFGADENDFECEIQSSSHCCEAGSYLYIEGTEYGGVVDKIQVDTEDKTVTYMGRTWHGILFNSIIEPEPGYDYYVVTGEANAALAGLISHLGLSGIFTASTKDSGITVSYSFRYDNAYSGIRRMLAEYGGKLKFAFKTDTVVLSAEYYRDYSRDEEWDASQVDFTVKKDYRPVNHLICLGGGNLRDRCVIHLFADEYGGIQPCTKTASPLSDDDYILDCSKQLLFGVDEIADTYDYPNAQTVENYIVLEEQPDDWSESFESYYTLSEHDMYENVTGTPIQVYELQTEQPEDWETCYANYFTADGEEYKAVEGAPGLSYRVQLARPADWYTNCENYYYRSGDNYYVVTPNTFCHYEALTQKPVNWDGSQSSYYTFASGNGTTGGYIPVTGNPEFEAGRYYYAVPIYYSPDWQQGTYYTLEVITVAPTWAADTYYTLKDTVAKPSFAPGAFYQKKIDNYADLVQCGVERMKELLDCDSISIDLDPVDEFDIGDMVGALDNVTGISVWQPITKKIVTIENGKTTISYKVGD